MDGVIGELSRPSHFSAVINFALGLEVEGSERLLRQVRFYLHVTLIAAMATIASRNKHSTGKVKMSVR